MITIAFDMDGTVADLYGKKTWLEEIRNETLDFSTLKPICSMSQLDDMIFSNREENVKFVIITWSPMNCSEEYHEKVSKQKRAWVKKYMPYITEFYCIPYGMPKQDAPVRRSKRMYLIDDNAEVLATWATDKQRISVQVDKGYNSIMAVKDILTGVY